MMVVAVIIGFALLAVSFGLPVLLLWLTEWSERKYWEDVKKSKGENEEKE